MAFVNNGRFEKFENKIWLASPTMYPESMRYVMEAYETNWMSTVGANINKLKKQRQKYQKQSMRLHYPVEQQPFIFV